MLRLIACFSLLCLMQVASAAEDKFDTWLIDLKKEALSKGITPETVDSALSSVQFVERVISSDRSQAEFKETYEEYLSKRVSEFRIRKGKAYLEEYGDAVEAVTATYGVPARVVVSIIGVETNYGTFTLKHSMFDVLSTLAYDKRRGARFRKEIFAALEILDKGHAELSQLKSSWAGALGVPQFMPSTYLQFAQDFDGDGTKNIWEHGPDLWASVAKYLSHYGWDNKKTWARKVIIPENGVESLESDKQNIMPVPKSCVRYKKHLQGWKSLSDWNEKGVRRLNRQSLPQVDIAASMIVTSPDESLAYLVYGNFCVLMRYNPSFKYALAVGVLSDKLK